MARENRSWGTRRIVGALSNVSHQTVANILERHGLLPAPDRRRKTSWREFIRSHTEVLAAVDFFTAEVWTAAGLITYYVLAFMRVGLRQVCIAGMTPSHDPAMDQTNGQEHALGRHRLPSWLQIPTSRSRHEVLFRLRCDPRSRRHPSNQIAAPQPQLERLLRTLDPVCKDRAPVEDDPYRRTFPPPLPRKLRGSLSCRAEPPRQGQPNPVSQA